MRNFCARYFRVFKECVRHPRNQCNNITSSAAESNRLLPKHSPLYLLSPAVRNFNWYPNISTVLKGSIFGGGLLLSIGGAFCYSDVDDSDSCVDELCRLSANPAGLNELLKLIKQGRVDVNQKHPLGWRAIHSAAMSGNVKTIQLLLAAGADPNLPDEFSNVYHVASLRGISVSKVVATRDSCFWNRLSKNFNFLGFTPLHYAALCEDLDSIKLLLEYGADPSAKDNSGHFAHEYSNIKSTKEYIQSFEK